MKRRTHLFLCAMCTGLMLAGLPAAAEESSTEVSTEDGAEASDFLTELAEANTYDAIVDRNGPMSCTITYIAVDGTESVQTTYQDDTIYVYEDDDTLLIDEAGDVYGIDKETGEGWRYLFVDDSYEYFLETYEIRYLFVYNEYELITSRTAEEGLIYLETAMTETDFDWGYIEGLGFDKSEVDSIMTEYVIDEETLEVLELNSYMVCGTEKILFCECVLDLEPEEYTVAEEVSELIYGENLDSITVVTDAGTEDEQSVTRSLSTEDGTIIIFYNEDNYDGTFYADPEYTEVVELSDVEGEVTVYMKRVEEE
ncbi:MAG: hypothetical protein LUD16_02675 [Lachnospiraceae bacterium]|nr:hypothetical protein [Lachnospiraceae bacterium]